MKPVTPPSVKVNKTLNECLRAESWLAVIKINHGFTLCLNHCVILVRHMFGRIVLVVSHLQALVVFDM